ncbi:polysaccharide deacetylase family protein [Paraconexibacter sp. AEG42_29]|uniref:polysaccharide deacetylase family protein n=1 Tax=Paraconexibacter sp. AEG42_29 TaxID=2997339 RepID=UPI00339D3B3D
MSVVGRSLRALARSWQQRSVQIASLGALALVLAFSAVVPFERSPERSARAERAPQRTLSEPPARRIVGPEKLPAPSPADAETTAVLAVGKAVGPIRHGGGARHMVALTFDDGPGPFTGPLLAVLRRTNTPATFFQVGRNLDENPLPARATTLLDEVELADHTYTHNSLVTMDFGKQQDEIVSSAATMQAHGEAAPRLFRPPYGAYNQDTLRLMNERGMAMILWSVDSEDYTRPGVDRIVDNVMKAVKPGSIILMHDGGGERSQTVAAVAKIIKRLRGRGYGLVTVPELLLKDPPQKADQEVAVVPPGAGEGAG